LEDYKAILQPILFNIFLNDLCHGLECTLGKFTHDTKPGDLISRTDGWTGWRNGQRGISWNSARGNV